MAGISRDLILRDKFSGTYNKFIKQTEQAANASESLDKQFRIAQTVLDDYVSHTKSGFTGVMAQLDKLSQAHETFVSKFGTNSIEAENAQYALEEALAAASMTMDEFLATADRIGSLVDPVEEVTEQIEETEQEIETMDSRIASAVNGFDDLTKSAQLYARALKLAKAKAIKLDPEDISLMKIAVKEADNLQKKLAKTEQNSRKASKGIGGMGRLFKGLATRAFGAYAVIRMLKAAMERVPNDVMKPFNKLKNFFSNTMAHAATGLMSGMRKGLDRLNKAFESPAGQRFVAMLQVGFEGLGELIGFVLGKLGELFEHVMGNIQKLAPAFAETFEVIGSIFGAFFVTAYNIFVTIYNVIVSLAELIANVFHSPADAVISLIRGVADFALDAINVVAKALDKVFGSNLSGTISGWKNSVDAWAQRNLSEDAIVLDRLEQIEYDEYMSKFAAAGRNFGNRLADAANGKTSLNAIKKSSEQTAANTKAIKNAVTDEDLKMLIDMATQKFVSNVNLTAQTPVITINGANTGNTEADRRALANTIKHILVEEIASGSTSGQYAYAGA